MAKKQTKEMWALRLLPEDKQKLREIAAKEGVNMTSAVVLMIRRSHKSRGL